MGRSFNNHFNILVFSYHVLDRNHQKKRQAQVLSQIHIWLCVKIHTICCCFNDPYADDKVSEMFAFLTFFRIT